MKNLSRAAALAVALCLVLSSVLPARAVIDPSSGFYVTDLTQDDVISSVTEKYIVAMNEQLESLTGAQIVIAAVDFIDGADIEDYSYTLYNEWKIGSAELNNGLLILLVIGEQNYWGVQGAGIRDALTSGLIADYLNTYLEPDFAAAKYDSGIRAVFDAFVLWYSSYYGVTVSVSQELANPPVETQASSSTSGDKDEDEDKPSRTEAILAAGFTLGKIAKWFLISIASLTVLTLVLLLVLRRRHRVRTGAAATFFPRIFRRRRPAARRTPPPPPPNVNPYSRGSSPDGQYSYVRPKNGTTRVRPGYQSGFSGSYHTPNTGTAPKAGPAPKTGAGSSKNRNVRPSNKYDNLYRFNGVNSGGFASGSRPSSRSSSRPASRSGSSAPNSGGFTRGGGAGRSSSFHSSGSAGRSSSFHGGGAGRSSSFHGGGGFTRGGGAGRRS